jgi:hypothetical protein
MTSGYVQNGDGGFAVGPVSEMEKP